jgi:hypothetical protein
VQEVPLHQDGFQPLVDEGHNQQLDESSVPPSDPTFGLGIAVGIFGILICLYCVLDLAWIIMTTWQLSNLSHNPMISFTVVIFLIIVYLLFYSIIGTVAGLHNTATPHRKYVFALHYTIALGVTCLLLNGARMIYGFFVTATMGFAVAVGTVFIGIVINIVCCTFCITLGAFYARFLGQKLPPDNAQTHDLNFFEKIRYYWSSSATSQKVFGILTCVFVCIVLLGILIATIVSGVAFGNPSNVTLSRFQNTNCVGRQTPTDFKTNVCYPTTGGESVKFYIEGGKVHLNEYVDAVCGILSVSLQLDIGTCYNTDQNSFRLSIY